MSRFVRPYIDKVNNFRRIIKQNGGYKASLYKLYMTDDLKDGTLMGTDKYGNKYYQNNRYFFSRNRWIIYADKYHLDYDGSQIPAEWHGWMHYVTDKTPVTDPPVQRKWMIDHEENLSGTKNCYVPYSTTRPKIESWKPC